MIRYYSVEIVITTIFVVVVVSLLSYSPCSTLQFTTISKPLKHNVNNHKNSILYADLKVQKNIDNRCNYVTHATIIYSNHSSQFENFVCCCCMSPTFNISFFLNNNEISFFFYSWLLFLSENCIFPSNRVSDCQAIFELWFINYVVCSYVVCVMYLYVYTKSNGQIIENIKMTRKIVDM